MYESRAHQRRQRVFQGAHARNADVERLLVGAGTGRLRVRALGGEALRQHPHAEAARVFSTKVMPYFEGRLSEGFPRAA